MIDEVENNVVENADENSTIETVEEANDVVDAFEPVIEIRGQKYSYTYQVEDTDKFTKKFVVKVEGDLFLAMEKESYYANKGRYSIPGFRKGKATMHAIKSYYGNEVFVEGAVDYAIDSIYRLMYRPVFLKLNMAASPNVEIRGISMGSFEYAYIITVYPEVGEINYKNLEIHCYNEEKFVQELADKKLEDAHQKAGSWQEVTDRALLNGDTANIDYLGKVDDVPFEGGEDKGYDLVIGSNQFVPGFESQLVGMNVGETRDINVTFPEDYHAELAGKLAVFTVTLNSIKEKQLPELDDEFAKDVSEFDTLDELKESYKKEAQEEGHKQVENMNTNIIIDTIVDATEYDVPENAVLEQAEDQVKNFEDRLKHAGLSFEQYAMYAGITREKMLEDYKAECEKREKRNMVLSAIIEREELKIDEADLTAKIEENASKAGKTVEEYRKEIKNDEVDYMMNQILQDKLMVRLKELNNIICDL